MTKYGNNKDISALLETVEEQGWRVRPSAGAAGTHFRVYSPDGKSILTVSCSKRKPMALRRLIADFRRAGAVL